MRERKRLTLPVACDLSHVILMEARDLLVDAGDEPVSLLVHPYAKHLAQTMLYHIGLTWPVCINADWPEDAWLLIGATHEVYSDGA